MKKIGYAVHRLALEYKGMHRPGRKELLKKSARVTGTAAIAAVILKIVDTGFAAFLALIL